MSMKMKQLILVVLLLNTVSFVQASSCWEMICCCFCCFKKTERVPDLEQSFLGGQPINFVAQQQRVVRQRQVLKGQAGVELYRELFPELAAEYQPEFAQHSQYPKFDINVYDSPYLLVNENPLVAIQQGRMGIDQYGFLYGRR